MRPGFPTTPGCPCTPRPRRRRPAWPAEALLARSAALPAPGAWAYSNIGYLLARRAIESPQERRWRRLRTRLLEPLGLAATRLAEHPGEMDALALPAPGYDPGWVYHGCLLGPVADAAAMLAGILAGPLLSPGSRRALLDAIPVGGRLSGRPWLQAGYGLGLMTGRMQSRDGPLVAAGHSAGGPGSGGAAYRFPDLPDAPCVAVFGRGDAAAACEWRAVDLARGAAERRAGFRPRRSAEAAVDQPLAVERHRVRPGCIRGSSIIFFHAVVARVLGRPDDPGEDHGLVVLALHRHRERGDLNSARGGPVLARRPRPARPR